MNAAGNPTLSDLDQDEAVDLIFLQPGIRVWRGHDDGTFSAQTSVEANYIAPQVVDVNGDNRADVVAGSKTTNEFWVYLNASLAPSAAPDLVAGEEPSFVAIPSVANRGSVELRMRREGVERGSTTTTVDVVDLGGRIVRNLGSTVAGTSEAVWLWDLKDNSGHDVQNGVYWARLDSSTLAARIVVLRVE